MSKFLIILCACFCLARPALAWNSQGHQVVAQIAYIHLDPQVKAKCDALLTNDPICNPGVSHTFVGDSTWADGRCEVGTDTQHYLDIPIALGTCLVENVVYDPTNVVTAIQQEIATLQNPNATVSSQVNALRYLIHFVGDIQQPCHSSTGVTCSQLTGDRGGNDFSLGRGNLHSFWDSGGGYLADGMSVSSKAAAVEADYPYAKSIGIIPNPMDWAVESHDVAQTNTYVGITNGLPASASYSNKTHVATEWRMAMGGQRLAKLLNTIFATNVPVVVSANIADPNFSFSWSSVSGRTYRVQWKQQPGDATWTDLTDVTATTNSTSFSESTTGTDQRFYRAIVVN